MDDRAAALAATLSQVLQRSASEAREPGRDPVRQLLAEDPLERLIPAKLLAESAAKLFEEPIQRSFPMVLFMDRFGGGDGARAAAGLMPVVQERFGRASFVHVSFETPPRGLGMLVRRLLTQAGAKHGIDVHVVAHPVSAGDLVRDETGAESESLGADLVVTFAPSGSAGLLPSFGEQPACDPLISGSHLIVASFVDPESLVAELPRLEQIVGQEPSMDGLEAIFSVWSDGARGEMGRTVIGDGGDARDRLWRLLDNAKRRVYQVDLQPMLGGGAVGRSLACPCRARIAAELGRSASVLRVVPAGGRLVAVARGLGTLNS